MRLESAAWHVHKGSEHCSNRAAMAQLVGGRTHSGNTKVQILDVRARFAFPQNVSQTLAKQF